MAAGHRNVEVVPLFVEPGRFAAARADPKLKARLAQGGPRLVSVSRVVAHKRFEDLLRSTTSCCAFAPTPG